MKHFNKGLIGGLALTLLQACQNDIASQDKTPTTDDASIQTEPMTQTHDTSKSVSVELEWIADGFDAPESVVPNADGSLFYVSNVNGDGVAKDGNGYIATLSPMGDIINQNWVTGLDAPKGLALDGARLYVSDIDRLVVIDTESARILETIPFEGAGFLNDVTVAPIGILVSDSANQRIYRYAEGRVEIWLEAPVLSGVNGLLPQTGHLLVTTMSDGALLSVDWETKTITKLASDMKNADGVSPLKGQGYLVSSWPGKLYHVNQDGHAQILIDTEDAPIYWNDFYLLDDALYVPNWQPGTVRRYKVSHAAQ